MRNSPLRQLTCLSICAAVFLGVVSIPTDTRAQFLTLYDYAEFFVFSFRKPDNSGKVKKSKVKADSILSLSKKKVEIEDDESGSGSDKVSGTIKLQEAVDNSSNRLNSKIKGGKMVVNKDRIKWEKDKGKVKVSTNKNGELVMTIKGKGEVLGGRGGSFTGSIKAVQRP